MNTAVILAAGMGSRLRGVVENHPKGFLQLGDRTIVEESIARLRAAGIDNVIIVTGYCAEYYDALAANYGERVTTVHNPSFQQSGSMYSLYCARDLLDAPFLLLESDLIYEKRALEVLLQHSSDDAILLAGRSDAGDEVYVSTQDGCLHAMSKDRAQLGDEIAGELVGICKISTGLFELMIDISRQAFTDNLMFDYETDCLVAAGRSAAIACPVVDDLLWAEIDDAAHLARARDFVYPAIIAAESA